MAKSPEPRTARYCGSTSAPHYYAHGTWIESEEITYPSGAMIRRARAINESTGKLQVVRCGLHDTPFSIPVKGGGFLSVEDDPKKPNYRAIVFHPPIGDGQTRRNKCECTDPGCPVDHGHGKCGARSSGKVYRVDMEDITGTAMCAKCMEDALDSGVFTTRK